MWDDLNRFEISINEGLFYNVNHRLMVNRLLDLLDNGENNE